MTNLDRFSRPLSTERVNPSEMKAAIEEQRYLNKRDIVSAAINDYVDEFNRFPKLENVYEFFQDLDIDHDLIEDALKSVQSYTKLLPTGEF